MGGTEGGRGAGGRACMHSDWDKAVFGSPALNWRVKAHKAGIWGYMQQAAGSVVWGKRRKGLGKRTVIDIATPPSTLL